MAGRPRKEDLLKAGEEVAKNIAGQTIAEQVEENLSENIANQVEENFKAPIIPKNNVVEFISTGSDIYDLVGGGGSPLGMMINVIGDKSTGKTLFSCETIAKLYWEIANQASVEEKNSWLKKPEKRDKYVKQHFEWIYDNSESGFHFDTKSIWGFQIESEYRSTTIEGFAVKMNKVIEKLTKDREKFPDKKFVYIVDSWDGLSSKEEQDHYIKKMKAIEKGTKVDGTYGTGKAKGGHEFFRNMTYDIEKAGIILIIVSQVKENINAGTFEPKYIRTGGKALDFFAAQIFWYAVSEKYGEKGRETGVGVKIINTKNKVGLPFRFGYVDILFDYGVDNLSSNIKFLYDLKTDKGKDKEKLLEMILEWDGIEYSYRGLIRYIELNNLELELTKRVKEKWYKIEAEIKTDRKRKFE